MNALLFNRWFQLAVGVVAMVATANLQYGWTLFVDPIAQAHGWKKDAIQWAFTLFVISQTWLAPLLAYLRDKLGPQGVIAVGGLMVGGSWILNSYADTLTMLYVGGVIAGIGGGIVYTTAMGNALKLFPDQRGLAAGITSMAFGAGAALSVIPIYNMVKASGYQRAFFVFGIIQGGVILLCSLIMRRPSVIVARMALEVKDSGAAEKLTPTPDTAPTQMLRTPVFYVLYVMFTMVATGGLMAVAQLGPIAKDYKIADSAVSILGLFTVVALPFTLQMNQILNGLTRPFFGWLSDKIGRELTMFIAFTAEGFAIFALIYFAHNPVSFVLFSALAFFAWGEIYSIFPAISGDLFGAKYATTNYAFLYTAKGTASLLIPLGSWLKDTYGSWKPIFYTAVAFDWIAAILAIAALKPMCAAYKAKMRAQQPGASASAARETTLAQGVLPRVRE